MSQPFIRQWVCDSVDDVPQFIAEVLPYLRSGRILFEGPLGAGKTTLIQHFVAALGCNETISSPTYSLINLYDECRIAHLDLYRLRSVHELEVLGLDELSAQWFFIEWGLQFEQALEPIEATIYLRPGDHENQRIITLSYEGL